MQILEEDSGRIRRFDKFEGTLYVGMRGLGRISIRSVHARGVGEIEFRWMQILENDLGWIRRFDKFEETSHVEMQGFGRIFIRSGHAHGLGEIEFWVDANP